MIRLTHWYLKELDEAFSSAWGIVSGHDRLLDGTFIHTSWLRKVELDESEKQLRLLTYSGNHYYLDWSEINENHIEDTRKVLGQFGVLTDFLKFRKELKEQFEKELMSEINSILKKRELLWIPALNRAFFKNSEDIVEEAFILIHGGMFQDSVLIRNREVDFRYFPMSSTKIVVEPYHWSNGLEAVLIDNRGEKEIEFVGSKRRIICKAGEITRIESKEYSGEGLLSPDTVDGKCFWNNGAVKGNIE